MQCTGEERAVALHGSDCVLKFISLPPSLPPVSVQLESMKLSEQIIRDNAGPNAVREAVHQFPT